jgi:glutaconate CoA-transferase subunit B
MQSNRYSLNEFLAILISRQIQNGTLVWVGTSSDIPRAGAILANLLHAPDSSIILGLDMYNFHDLKPGEVNFKGLTSTQAASRYHLKTLDLVWVFDNIPLIDFFVIGGIEVDQFGNTNLMGIYDSDGKLKTKGPGPIGAASMASSAKEYVIFMNRHSKSTFVDKVSFRSAFGFGDGFDNREKLGLIGNGPKCLISPLGVFTFPKPARGMKLQSVHPGVSIEQIIDRTGFDLATTGNEPFTIEPSEMELDILRSKVDPSGELRVSVE